VVGCCFLENRKSNNNRTGQRVLYTLAKFMTSPAIAAAGKGDVVRVQFVGGTHRIPVMTPAPSHVSVVPPGLEKWAMPTKIAPSTTIAPVSMLSPGRDSATPRADALGSTSPLVDGLHAGSGSLDIGRGDRGGIGAFGTGDSFGRAAGGGTYGVGVNANDGKHGVSRAGVDGYGGVQYGGATWQPPADQHNPLPEGNDLPEEKDVGVTLEVIDGVSYFSYN
jgi:hypothetical protein